MRPILIPSAVLAAASLLTAGLLPASTAEAYTNIAPASTPAKAPAPRAPRPSAAEIDTLIRTWEDLNFASGVLDMGHRNNISKKDMRKLEERLRTAQVAYGKASAAVGIPNVDLDIQVPESVQAWAEAATARARRSPRNNAALREARSATAAWTQVRTLLERSRSKRPQTTPHPLPAGYNPAKEGKYVPPRSIKITSTACTLVEADDGTRFYRYKTNLRTTGGTFVIQTAGRLLTYTDGKDTNTWSYGTSGPSWARNGRLHTLADASIIVSSHSVLHPEVKRMTLFTDQGKYMRVPCPAEDSPIGTTIQATPTFASTLGL